MAKGKLQQKVVAHLKQEGGAITWRAAEYEYSPKDVGWYWIVGGASAAIALVGLWQRNFFFAIFIVLAGVLVIAFGRRRPEVIDFAVGEQGIGVGNRLTEYDRIESFSVRARPGRLNEVIIKKKAAVNPYVRIPVDAQLAANIRTLLLAKLPEVEHEESLIDTLSDWLRF